MKRHLFYFLLTLLPCAVSAQITHIGNATEFMNASSTGGSSSNPVILKLTADITLTNFFEYFTIGGDYVTFDGDGYTIEINTGNSNYPGIFENGSAIGPVNGYSNITIKNLRVFVSGAVLESNAGWIGQEGFGFNATNVSIENCHTNYPGMTVNLNSGGIVGWRSPATIANCSSNGPIANAGGGIAGRFFSGTVINCNSTGNVGTNGGGITGSYSTGTAINCYSTGTIGNSAGGIMGSDAGNDGAGVMTPATATNCYSTGTIAGSNSGGIMAQKFNGTVTNCYSTGNINGARAGGIAGHFSPGNVTNCYTTGNIIGGDAGGIVGSSSATPSSGTITNCYTIGSVSGSGAGGITGSSFSGALVGTNVSSNSGSWDDNISSSALTGTDGTVWTDVDLPSSTIPFKLTAFDAAIYTPSTEDQLNNPVINSPTGNFSSGTYSIISLNDADPSSGIASINSVDGILSFNNPGLGSYVAKVLYTDQVNGSYQINSYTLNVVSVLPLTWLSFDVWAKGSSALLSWSTSSEQNTHNFEVQRSTDGNGWSTIGTVAAKGNSNVTTTYNYSDLKPENGNNNYRLKQTDIDGKFNYSIVRNLRIVPKSKTFSLLSNPVSNGLLQVNVQVPTTLLLYKSDGTLLWKKQFNAGTQSISIYEISKGMYFLMGGDTVERVMVR